MSFFGSTNFIQEVSKGNIPGHSIVHVIGRNPSVGTAFEDIWDAGGTFTYATSGEQWEVVSTSTNDSAAGTGARTMIIEYLDSNYTEQSETITLNGTTAVSTIATNMFRMVKARVNTAGSTFENQGELILRVVGGGSRRGGILRDTFVANDANGLNASQDAHYTVPAGKTVYLEHAITNVSKNHDMVIRLKSRLFGEDVFSMDAELSNYQSSFPIDLSTGPIKFVEKTDIKVVARSNNDDVPVNVIMIFLVINN